MTAESESKERLRDELSKLVRHTREEYDTKLLPGVESALRDWRFSDVAVHLQVECDVQTKQYEAYATTPASLVSEEVISRIQSCLMLQLLSMRWRLLREKFTDAGVDFDVPR